ncbi:MAG: D-tyrosyl-tRNA(Tyr) deacylase [candidate division Zixibacteria bacterium]|nr:D-tyrosyl-tRNA(Tyr) deacylase [candidate division Zixibacteria bacterium]
MRLLIQRVSQASVTVGQKIVGEIGKGFLVLCGFKKDDSPDLIGKLTEKCLNLRVFEDNQGKMNLSLLDISGELLVISQFTLYANCRKGRRPSFDNSMPPQQADVLYKLLIKEFQKSGLKTATGVFGAKMDISLNNDGPVTIMLDDDELFQSK